MFSITTKTVLTTPTYVFLNWLTEIMLLRVVFCGPHKVTRVIKDAPFYGTLKEISKQYICFKQNY